MPHRIAVLVVGVNYAPEMTGIAPYTAGLAEGLASRGHRVRVITAFPHYPAWRFDSAGVPLHRRESLEGVRVDRVRHLLPRSPIGVQRFLSELSFGVRAAARRWGRPDVVVLVSPALFASVVALLRARLARRPVVTWVQDLYALGLQELGDGGSGTVTRVLAAVESWVLRHSDRVVVIHDRFREHVVRSLSVPEGRVDVVRNWTHLQPGVNTDRAAVRRSLGWGEDEVVVLHVGNMGVKQGLGNVIEAAKLAERSGSAVRFVLLGDGNQRAELERQGGDATHVQFIAPLPDREFRQTMESADVLLVNEKPGVGGMAVPSKLTSYFAAGLPVLAASDPGGVTESEVRASGGGVVVRAGDPAALLEAAVALGRDPRRRAELGAAGREYRHTHLSVDGAMQSYARLLADVVHQRRRP
ncbi:glycosyltransferase family 4 protein [Curtobacterium sp. MCBD17_035]|uniref:glycosyltransferase family 4 protein n=1 Tax=Curtobacterium sp. MCBD17_035 TaxID=2175673 RepID=UPI0021AC43FC|nr:glycosyltransferase family 4 protein [Curtobacterium sp. MCBD17_035]WIB67974.1 glycosyltransferase family 4 protein [Curtobacterium sp. MCBD17_035]